MARKKSTVAAKPKAKTIEEEAKVFIEEKKKSTPKKEITPRMQLTGSILAGLLTRLDPHTPPEEVVNQARNWVKIIEDTE